MPTRYMRYTRCMRRRHRGRAERAHLRKGQRGVARGRDDAAGGDGPKGVAEADERREQRRAEGHQKCGGAWAQEGVALVGRMSLGRRVRAACVPTRWCAYADWEVRIEQFQAINKRFQRVCGLGGGVERRRLVRGGGCGVGPRARRTAGETAREQAEKQHAQRTHGEDERGGWVGADQDEEREQKALRHAARWAGGLWGACNSPVAARTRA